MTTSSVAGLAGGESKVCELRLTFIVDGVSEGEVFEEEEGEVEDCGSGLFAEDDDFEGDRIIFGLGVSAAFVKASTEDTEALGDRSAGRLGALSDEAEPVRFARLVEPDFLIVGDAVDWSGEDTLLKSLMCSEILLADIAEDQKPARGLANRQRRVSGGSRSRFTPIRAEAR